MNGREWAKHERVLRSRAVYAHWPNRILLARVEIKRDVNQRGSDIVGQREINGPRNAVLFGVDDRPALRRVPAGLACPWAGTV